MIIFFLYAFVMCFVLQTSALDKQTLTIVC